MIAHVDIIVNSTEFLGPWAYRVNVKAEDKIDGTHKLADAVDEAARQAHKHLAEWLAFYTKLMKKKK